MKKVNSKEYPTIKRLQGVIIVPANITPIEDGYNWIRVDYPLTSTMTDEELLADANKKYAASNKDSVLAKGFQTSLGFKIDCMPSNVIDFSQTLSLISLLPDLTEVEVRDYNNVNHTITVAEYKQMCIELGMYVTANRQGYWSEVDSFGLTSD